MFGAIRNLIFGQRTRSFDGAGGGRRWKGGGEMANQPAAVLASRATIARRARYIAANHPLAKAGVEAWTSGLVNTGIKGQSAHPNPDERIIINAAFERWTDIADADGRTDFYGLQDLAVRRMIIDGEALALFGYDEKGRFRLRLIDTEQLDGSLSRELPGGGRIVSGVEFDAAGTRTHYHLFTSRPGEGLPMRPVRVPAENVVHMFRGEAPGQIRGMSAFAPVLLRLMEHDASINSQLVRQKVAASLTGFITDPAGQGGPFATGEQPSIQGMLEGGLEPGTLKLLLPGQDIRFSTTADIGAEVIQFMMLTAREIAAGLGVPYESLTGDLSSVNFSSIRAGLVDFRRRCEAIQYSTIVPQLLRPVWRRWLTTEILSGRIKVSGFDTNSEDALAVRWITPKQQWVDPRSDVEAETAAIAAGLMSRREAVASRGIDIEALDAEIAADNARAKTLGLDFTAKATPKVPAQ